jgi:hypothetical protein
VRRGVKIVVWILAFAVSAGVGAFIASKTNPFPPGVEDPGARPSTSSTVTPSGSAAQGIGYLLEGTARTRHDLHVGGSCATDWSLTIHVSIVDPGQASGTGVARLRGDLRCDFPTAQTQATRVALSARGSSRGDVLDLTLLSGGTFPGGSSDFGGLTSTLRLFPNIRLAGDAGRGRSAGRLKDGDLGDYVATYVITARRQP